MILKLMDWEGERVPKIDESWMLACFEKSLINKWLRKPKFQKILKITLPKTMYFLHAFFNRFLERFGAGLGRGLGPPWRLLGHFKASFFKASLPRGPKRVQEAAKRPLGLDLAWFWTGFGKGLGSQNGQKVEVFDLLFQT